MCWLNLCVFWNVVFDEIYIGDKYFSVVFILWVDEVEFVRIDCLFCYCFFFVCLVD